MAIVPRWARAKVLRAKRNRRSTLNKKAAIQRPMMQTGMFKDEFGATILYRDHVRSAKFPESKQMPDETTWFGYPTEFVAFLSCFDKVPDDQLPPLVAVTRKRKKEWQSSLRGQGNDHTFCITVSETRIRHIFCFLSGRTAYFIWLSHLRGLAYRSADYASDYAQLVIERHQGDGNFSIEDNLHWIETAKIPSNSIAVEKSTT